MGAQDTRAGPIRQLEGANTVCDLIRPIARRLGRL